MTKAWTKHVDMSEIHLFTKKENIGIFSFFKISFIKIVQIYVY